MAGERVHVIDRNVKRRAAIAYELSSRHYRPEIYESLVEVGENPPRDGYVLLHHDFAGEELSYLTAMLAASLVHVPVIVFGENPSTGGVVQAMLAGAADFLEWPFAPERFEESITRAASDARTHARVLERRHNAVARLQALTEREREVLRHLIHGHGSKDLAVMLGISPRTVEVHRGHLIAKLAARSTSDAIRIGIYGGLDD